MKRGSRSLLPVIARYAVLAAVIVLILIAVDMFLGDQDKVAYTPPKPLVVVQQPQKGTVAKQGTFPSYVQAMDTIPVIPLVGGTVETFAVSVGQLVEKDETLATLDSKPFIQQVKQAEAAYLASESTFARIESLHKSKAMTDQGYDQAKAQRDAAKAQYELANLQLGYATVQAPVSGTILMKNSSVGSLVGVQQPLAVIADLSSLVVKVEIPETYYDVFWHNVDDLGIEVTSPSWNAPVKASLVHIDPFVQSDSKTFTLEALLEDGEALVRPGMAVSVCITYEKQDDAFRMSQSVRKSDGSWYIYHPELGRVEYVLTGVDLEDEEFFKVPKAYQDSYFVVDGQHMLFDNQEVRIKGDLL